MKIANLFFIFCFVCSYAYSANQTTHYSVLPSMKTSKGFNAKPFAIEFTCKTYLVTTMISEGYMSLALTQ